LDQLGFRLASSGGAIQTIEKLITSSMPAAYIETPYSRIKLHSERLFVLSPQEKDKPDVLLAQIPLNDLDRVVIHEHAIITTPAVIELMHRNIPLHFLDRLGHPLADCLPAAPAASATRLRQYQCALDPDFALAIARSLIQAKVFNQHRVLQRLESNHTQGLEADLLELASFQTRAAHAANLPELLGVEGISTGLYFRIWSRFLPNLFPFERRSSRPPHNPVNACISFGATLLYQELRTAVHMAGLDPALGFLHANDDGRFSLALDLMEPFRPAVAEALCLRLFSLGILKTDDFEPSHGGIYLSTSGRKKFLAQYEQRLTREFLSEQAGHRTNLRQQFRAAAANLKASLFDPGKFNPFRLN
jgi:CRISPR-associated protein Cas1